MMDGVIPYSKLKKLEKYLASGLRYKGVLKEDKNIPISGLQTGDFYKIDYNGTFTDAGKEVEVGNIIVFNGDTNSWDIISSSGDGAEPKIVLKSNVTVGAIASGTNVNNTSSELWKMALVKNVAPVISFTSTLNKNIVYEKGVTQNTTLNVKITLNSNGGTDLTGVTYTSSPVDSKFTGSKILTSPSSYSDSVLTSFSDNQEFKVSATDKNNLVANSTIKFTFVHPIYVGLVDYADIGSIDETILKDNSSKLLATKSNQTTKLNSNGDYKCPIFCYPDSYGSLTKIMDIANGFDLMTGYNTGTIQVSCADGSNQMYRYYVAKIYNRFDDFEISFQY